VICYEISGIPEVWMRRLDSGFHGLDSGFQRRKNVGFRIPKPWIPNSKGKKMLHSGFRIPLHGAINSPHTTFELFFISL